jgi:uncharacterized metal-binding protein YceD (DUF177 family)
MHAGYRPENAAKMASLVIPIHHLDAHGRDYVFALDQAWLDGVLQGTGVRGDATAEHGAVQVHAQRNGREILVHGKAHARLVTECGRCLKDFPLEVACDLAALFAPSEARVRASEDDEELDDIDPERPDREFYSGEQVVIDELVRDYLLLEIPMQPRCDLGWSCPNLDVPEQMRGGEGVHSQSSGEDRIDPRLIPLMKLAKGEPEKE